MTFKTLMGAALCVQLIACAGPQVGRTGPAVTLPNGPPKNECEREDWYEVAPARVQATGATSGVMFNTYYSQLVDGLGVFRPGESSPQNVETLWPNMGEPKLQQKHQARIDPVDAANQRALLWALGGLVVGFTGVGVAAAVQDSDRTLAIAAGGTGLAAMLFGAIGALASQPSGEEQLHAHARRKLFIEGEDDRVAVERGVNNVNSHRRQECGGTSGVQSAPPPAPAPAPTPSAPAPQDASDPASNGAAAPF